MSQVRRSTRGDGRAGQEAVGVVHPGSALIRQPSLTCSSPLFLAATGKDRDHTMIAGESSDKSTAL